MAINDQWIIWVNQDTGRQFLGLPTVAQDDDQRARFCIIGRKVQEAFGFGLWVEVESVEKRAIPDNTVVGQWTVSPKKCLVPFQVISYVQMTSQRENIGFVKKSK